MISFIVPAHNEQAGLGRTLQAIHDSARMVGRPYEIIVVNDASTDATSEVARQHKATVVPVNHRQIAATRNSGARAAYGNQLFFVDADTTINPRTVAAAVRYMDKGAAGGGAAALPDGAVPLYIQLIGIMSLVGSKLLGFTGGAFMFCTREGFHATGGFDERLFWAEEGAMVMALKSQGRFRVVWTPVRTSGRRFRHMSALQVFGLLLRVARSPFKMFTRRAAVEKIWYDSNRENDDKVPNSVVYKLSNAIALLVLIVLIGGSIWNFVPWFRTPLSTPLGKIRLGMGIFLAHVGLILWPIALGLFSSLIRRKQWVEWLKLAFLFAFCVWQACDCTQSVVWFWSWLYHHLPK
jgi:glycosyltransferase involved in cell wall biosynthesis